VERYTKLKIADLHSHTRFSFDSQSDPEELILSAISKDIDVLAITDHADIDYEDCGMNIDLKCEERKELLLSLKKKYSSKIKVIFGIELGQPNNKRELADKLIADNGYEFVLGSVHNLKNVPDFCFFDYSKLINYPEMLDNLYGRYLDDLIALASVGYVDCITHVTYMLRYIQASGGDYDVMRHKSKYEELFKKIISSKKALEINTSNLRRGFGTTMPGEDLIKLYAELGGKLVTVGSDAHRVHEIGSGIEVGYELAAKYGLNVLTEINELY
jgi:histidinol-phosphatase (PHP family)